MTQGTHHVELTNLIQPAIEGLTDLNISVIATTGRRGKTDVGIDLPQNARIVDFLDFRWALPEAAVFVTNGGWGGVLASLAAGVPLVVAGGDIDKPAIAAWVARAGAGINLRTGRPRPEAVAAAVKEILADPAYAERARQIGAELASLGGAQKSVDLLETWSRRRSPYGVKATSGNCGVRCPSADVSSLNRSGPSGVARRAHCGASVRS